MHRLQVTLERLLPLGILSIACVGVPVLVLSPEGLPKLRSLEREFSSVNEENAELEREVEILRARVEKLREDPAAVERIARDQLGLVRRTEVVFQFPPKKPGG